MVVQIVVDGEKATAHPVRVDHEDYDDSAQLVDGRGCDVKLNAFLYLVVVVPDVVTLDVEQELQVGEFGGMASHVDD